MLLINKLTEKHSPGRGRWRVSLLKQREPSLAQTLRLIRTLRDISWMQRNWISRYVRLSFNAQRFAQTFRDCVEIYFRRTGFRHRSKMQILFKIYFETGEEHRQSGAPIAPLNRVAEAPWRRLSLSFKVHRADRIMHLMNILTGARSVPVLNAKPYPIPNSNPFELAGLRVSEKKW